MRAPVDFDGWREQVRPLLAAGIRPQAVDWDDLSRSSVDAPAAVPRGAFSLPRELMRLLDAVFCFRDDGRYELMYRLAWRIRFENHQLLEDAADRDVRNATLMASAIRRDVHKMHAFVRFREFSEEGGGTAYFAWFEPEHEILRKGAGFFVKRFPNMKWTIATPDGAAVWDMTTLQFVNTPDAAARPTQDSHEDLWRTYYRSICNVARINPPAMQREMPQKYWRNLPEASEIGLLIRDGAANFAGQHRESNEGDRVTPRAIKRAIQDLPPPGDGPQECRRCELWKHATQAVTGEGPAHAHIMLVGEQPGDEEDLRGHPFVGPAGKILDQAIAAAGLERKDFFVTNAVKHFKWEPRGKRRLHKKPDVREINACHVWLEREISAVKPRVIVALGATALRALVGSTLSIDAARQQTLGHESGARILATYHPSAILRSEGERVEELRGKLIEDLTQAAALGNVH